MSRSKRIEKEFVNKFGQVIHPGDEVIAITTCTHSTYIGKATYVGYVERDVYQWKNEMYKKEQFVQIRKLSRVWSKKENGGYEFVLKDRVSTLNYNNIILVNSTIETLVEAI